MTRYDAIVVGVGGMGSATLHALAKRGAKVLGLERFDIGHDRGSSHGETRIIRRAYFEHPDYVPLVDRAYELWREFEAECEQELLHTSGLLLSGPESGEIVSGTRRAHEMHPFDLDDLAAGDDRRRPKQFRIPKGDTVLFEPDAGFLRVDDCVRAFAGAAEQHGAKIETNCDVSEWRGEGDGIVVDCARGSFAADRLIVCAGPWAGQLLRPLQDRLTLQRRVVLWYPISGDAFRLERDAPVFGMEIGPHFFYGFPSLDGRTIKVAEHNRDDIVASADECQRSVSAEDRAHIDRFVREHLYGVSDQSTRESVCLYTMSPDSHFILGPAPCSDRVLVAAGFSGHGFKFAPVVGQALADLALDGTTNLPINFLDPARAVLVK